MDEPMNFAIVEDGVVTNIIWLCASNRRDFPNSVCVADRPVAIGDVHADGVFTRDGEAVPTYPDRIAQLEARIAELEAQIGS